MGDFGLASSRAGPDGRTASGAEAACHRAAADLPRRRRRRRADGDGVGRHSIGSVFDDRARRSGTPAVHGPVGRSRGERLPHDLGAPRASALRRGPCFGPGWSASSFRTARRTLTRVRAQMAEGVSGAGGADPTDASAASVGPPRRARACRSHMCRRSPETPTAERRGVLQRLADFSSKIQRARRLLAADACFRPPRCAALPSFDAARRALAASDSPTRPGYGPPSFRRHGVMRAHAAELMFLSAGRLPGAARERVAWLIDERGASASRRPADHALAASGAAHADRTLGACSPPIARSSVSAAAAKARTAAPRATP